MLFKMVKNQIDSRYGENKFLLNLLVLRCFVLMLTPFLVVHLELLTFYKLDIKLAASTLACVVCGQNF